MLQSWYIFSILGLFGIVIKFKLHLGNNNTYCIVQPLDETLEGEIKGVSVFINSLTAGRCDCNIRLLIFKFI